MTECLQIWRSFGFSCQETAFLKAIWLIRVARAAVCRSSIESHHYRLGGGELIHSFGDLGMRQPSSLVRSATHTLPPVRFQKLTQRQQGDDENKLLVLLPQFAQLLDQCRKLLPLKVLPEVLQCDSHAYQHSAWRSLFNKNQRLIDFCNWLSNPIFLRFR